LKYLYYSEEFKTFIRGKTNDMERALQALPRLGLEEINNRLKESFKNLSGKEINADLMMKCQGFAS